jgi:hypothetical protein
MMLEARLSSLAARTGTIRHLPPLLMMPSARLAMLTSRYTVTRLKYVRI